MTGTISISSTNWFPVSAVYAEDSYLTLSPQFIRNRDGYTVFHHKIFDYARDVVFNNQTNFVLTTALPLSYFISDTPISSNRVGSYIRVNRGNGVWYTRSDNTIGLSAVDVDDRSFYRMVYNTDDTVSILQKESLYLTINKTPPFSITLQPKIQDSAQSVRQRFLVNVVDSDRIYFTGYILNPHIGYGPSVYQRFLSFSSITSSIQAVGVVADDDYSIHNPFIFTVTGYETAYYASGMIPSQAWVSYYNDLAVPKYNRGTEIQQRINDIRVHRLVDIPANSQITVSNETGSMNINIANMKTVMTPEYRNYSKQGES